MTKNKIWNGDSLGIRTRRAMYRVLVAKQFKPDPDRGKPQNKKKKKPKRTRDKKCSKKNPPTQAL